MELLNTFLSEHMIQRIGWVLLHFLWQGITVAVLMWCVLKILGKVSANVRYIAACTGLVLMMAAPVATFVITAPKVSVAVSQTPVEKPVDISSSPTAAPANTIVIAPAESAALPAPSLWERLMNRLEALLPYCVTGWFMGVFVLSMWYLGGWCQLQRLRRIGTKAVSDYIEANASLLSQRLGIRRVVRIVESVLVQVPTVVGWLKPMVLLPVSALTGLDELQLQAMIAHELAHIKRCDYLVNIVQTVVEILGFYHPAVWWMSRQIRMERENCCDDIAITLMQNRKEYAGALFTMEAIRTKQHNLAVAANGSHLTSRISRLADKTPPGRPASGWIPAAVTFTLLIALISALAFTARVPNDSKDETLHFPVDYPLGEMYLHVDQPEYIHPFNPFYNLYHWEKLGLAQGDVKIPSGRRVRLLIYPEAWEHPEKLAPLQQFKPDDLYSLSLSPYWFPGKPPTDRCIPYVRHLTGLKELELCDSAITQNGLKQLTGMTQLEHIGLPQNLSNGALAAVAQLKSLKSIQFRQNRVTDKAVSLLAQLPQLEKLLIYGDNLTDEGLSYLPQLQRLEALVLGAGREFTPKGYEYIAQIPNLRTLWIDTHTCTDEKLRPLANHPTLEILSLHWENNITDQGLYYLAEIPQLKKVDIANAKMTNRGLEYLARLQNLDYLLLSHSGYTDEGIAHLAGLKNLTFLQAGTAGKSPLTDKSLNVISQLTKLQTLWTGGKGFTNAGMDKLLRLQELKELLLSPCPAVTDEGFAKLAGLENLEIFYWHGGGTITFEGLNQLVGLKKLKRLECDNLRPGTVKLNLSGLETLQNLKIDLPRKFHREKPYMSTFTESFSDKDLACLEGLKNLDFLQLCGDGISDEGLEYLSGLDNLGTLFIYGQTQITDEGIQRLAGLNKLWQLHIHNGHFTDAALGILTPMDGLERLELTSDRSFSNAAITEFKANKKNLKQLRLNPNGGNSQTDQALYGGAMYAAVDADTMHQQPPISESSSAPSFDIEQPGEELERQSDREESMFRMRQLGLAWFIYADDNDGVPANSIEDLKPYLDNETVYSWILDNAVVLNIWGDVVDPGKTPVGYDKTFLEKHDRRVTIFADGHVEIDNNDSLKDLLDKAIKTSERVERARELMSFGAELWAWAYEHNGIIPDNIKQVEFEDKALKEWALENVEYLGAGKVLKEIEEGGKEVVAYDKNFSKTDDGSNLLFADGHVEFCEKERLRDIIDQTDENNSVLALPLNAFEAGLINQILDLVQKTEEKYPKLVTHWPAGPTLYHVDKQGEVTVWSYQKLWRRSNNCSENEVGLGSSELSWAQGMYYLPDGTPLESRWSERNKRGGGMKDIRINVGRSVAESERIGVIHRYRLSPDQELFSQDGSEKSIRLRYWKDIPLAILIRIDKPMRLASWNLGSLESNVQHFDEYDQLIVKGLPQVDTAALLVTVEFPGERNGSEIRALTPLTQDDSPQILTTGYVVSVPADMPELKEIVPEKGTNNTKMISPEKLDTFLNTIRKNPKAKILANPRILSKDNEKAEVAIVEEVPYTQEDGEVAYRDIGFKLSVTPHISPDGNLRIEVLMNHSRLVEEGISMTETATTATIRSGYAIAMGGHEVGDNIEFLLIQPAIQESPSSVSSPRSSGMASESLPVMGGGMAGGYGGMMGGAMPGMQSRMGGGMGGGYGGMMGGSMGDGGFGGSMGMDGMMGGTAPEKQGGMGGTAPGMQGGMGGTAPGMSGGMMGATPGGVSLPVQQIKRDRQLLETEIDFSSLTANTTIEEAIDLMRSSSDPPLPIVVLWADLSENAYIEKDTPIGVDGLGVMKLETGLRAIMRSLSASDVSTVDFIVEDGVITIGTPISLPSKIQTEIYDVTDIPHLPFNFEGNTYKYIKDEIEKLKKTIVQSIEPESWSENGGQGRIDIYSETKLVIYQTPQVHQKIKEYLSKRREELSVQIAIETRFLLVDDNFLEDIGLNVSLSADDETSGGVGDLVVGPANSEEILAALEQKPLAERELPPLETPKQKLQTLDDLQNEFLIRATLANRNVKTLTAPKAIVCNGEAATIQIHNQLTYHDIDEEQKFIQKGTTLDILPTVQNDGKEVLLKGYVQMTDVLETRPVEHNGKTYDIPYLSVANIPIHTIVENSGTVLIERLEMAVPKSQEGDKQRLLILIKPTVIEQQEVMPPARFGGGMMGGYGGGMMGGYGGGMMDGYGGGVLYDGIISSEPEE